MGPTLEHPATCSSSQPVVYSSALIAQGLGAQGGGLFTLCVGEYKEKKLLHDHWGDVFAGCSPSSVAAFKPSMILPIVSLLCSVSKPHKFIGFPECTLVEGYRFVIGTLGRG